MKKKHQRIGIGTILVVIPVLLIVFIILYAKLYGFERALKQLVISETDSLYTLQIEKASVNIITKRFTFDNITVTRSAAVTGKGIQVVHIPAFHLRFGSLISMLTVRKFNIQSLVIDEPEIELATAKNEKGPREQTLLSQQIVKLYPVIESLLKRFSIASLSIRRASFDVEKGTKSGVRLNFVDLLIENWDIAHLTPQSQLQLRIDAQDLLIGKAAINFSEIEYNWQKRQLVFSDFSVLTVDTISGSNVDIFCESLVLRHLDYQDLYKNQRYSLQKAIANNPTVIARLKLKKERKRNSDQNMITRVLKQAFGECAVDSVVVNNAQFHFVLQKDADSIKIHLPDVDVRLHTFKVIKDSSTFQLGEIDINLSRTAVSLPNDLTLSLDHVSFEKDRDLTVTHLRLMKNKGTKPLVYMGKLKVEYFNLMAFIFYKQIYAHGVEIEDGDIKLTNQDVHSNKEKKILPLIDLSINKIVLRNTAIEYADTAQRISAKGLSITAQKIRFDSLNGFKYALNMIRLQSLAFKHQRKKIDATAKGISFDGNAFKTVDVNLVYDSLRVTVKGLSAKSDELNVQDHSRWSSITLGNVAISGRIPTTPAKIPGKEKPIPAANVDTLKINQLHADLAQGKTDFRFDGKEIFMREVNLDSERFSLESITGELSAVAVQANDLYAKAGKISVSYPAQVRIRDIHVETDRVTVSLKDLAVNTIRHGNSTWHINTLNGGALLLNQVHQGTPHPLLTTDSLHVAQVTWDGKEEPTMAWVELYHPVINRRNKSTQQTPGQHRHYQEPRLPLPDRLILHPGELRLPEGKVITFGKWDADLKKGVATCAFIHGEVKKSVIDLRAISLRKNQVRIDTLWLRSNPTWYKTITVEESEINAGIYHITLNEFLLDSLLKHHSLKGVNVDVERFTMDVRRDKRLPDPPPTIKPVTLDGLIPLPENIRLNALTIHDGSIYYTEVSDKTGEEGWIKIDKISAEATFDRQSAFISLHATNTIYDQGNVELDYHTLDTATFKLSIKAKDMNLTKFNAIVVPLKALEIKSGYLASYEVNLIADDEKAVGTADITDKNLHLTIFKRSDPEKKRLAQKY